MVWVTTRTSSSSRQVRDDDVEHEAVELRFGQRIGAFLLDRVLRREHEERALELIGPARRRDVFSCIASSSAAWVFGGVRLISSASRICAKIGPFTNRRLRWPFSSSSTSVPVMSAGIRSGVNWIRLNDRSRISRERLDQQRLRQTGHAGEQAVPAGEERHQDLVDDVVLPDDHLADLGEDPRAAVGHALGDEGQSRLLGGFHQCVSE